MKNLLYFSVISFCLLSACANNEFDNEITQQELGSTEVPSTIVSSTEAPTLTKAAEASFSVDHDHKTLLEMENLKLTNNSFDAVSYHWDFGNGDTSTEANPTYSYENHGYRTVTLTITDKHGSTHSVSEEILVLCIFGGGDHTQ